MGADCPSRYGRVPIGALALRAHQIKRLHMAPVEETRYTASSETWAGHQALVSSFKLATQQSTNIYFCRYHWEGHRQVHAFTRAIADSPA